MAGKAKSIEAGNAFVRLFTKDGELRTGLKNAGTMLNNFGAKSAKIGGVLTGLAALVVTPLISAALAYESAGSALDDAAQRTGVPVEELSSLSFAAEMCATNLVDLEDGMSKMDKTMVAAAGGSKSAQKALSDLGLSVSDLAGRSKADQFRLLAEAISRIEDPAQQTAAAMAIFGRGGVKLLPMLKEGIAGLAKWEQQARDLGLVMSTEDAVAAAEFGDAIGTIRALLSRMVVVIGTAVTPLLKDLADFTILVVHAFGQWVSANRELFAWGLKIAAIVAAVGAAFVAVGAAGMVLGAILSGLGTFIGIVAAGFSAVVSVVMFVLSPFGMLVALVGGLIAYCGAAGEALDWLKDRFAALAGDATEAFGLIGRALAAGDLGTAAEVLWAMLKVQWVKGVESLFQVWSDVKHWFISIWTQAVGGVVRVSFQVWDALQGGFSESIRFIADLWSIFSAGLMKGWFHTIGFIQKAWVQLKGLVSDDIDVDAEVSRINKETEEKAKGVDAQRDASIYKREQFERQRRAEQARQRRDFFESFGQVQGAQNIQNDGRHEDELRRSREALKRAQEEYDQAITDAEKALPATEDGKNPVKVPEFALPDFSGAVAQGESKISSSGTFSASGAVALGTTLDNRIATATERSAGYLRTLVEKRESEQEAVG